MAEAMPEAGRVDSSIMVDQLKNRLSDMFMEVAFNTVYDVEEKVIATAADIMNQHNMMDTTYGKTSARMLRQQIEDFEQGGPGEDMELLMRECVSDIEGALDKMVGQMAEYIVHIIGPQAR